MTSKTKSSEKIQTPKIDKTTQGSWINWFVPLLLILVAIAALVFYPKPKNKPSPPPQKQVKANNSKNFVAADIAEQLVTTFFNGSDEDNTEQTNALQSTLEHLSNNTNEASKTASEATIAALKISNIDEAIKTLITQANQQDNLRESAKTWVDIGNIQNLTSTRQALQAYQKASNLDSDNSDAWNRQGHIHRQLKQFELAEIAYKKVHALANQSTSDQALSLLNFGQLNQSKGDFKAAEEAFLKAAEIYTNIGNENGIASTNENLANLYKGWNVYDRAEKHYLIALGIHEKRNNFQAMATLQTTLGGLYQAMKKFKKSQSHYEKALQISQENNFNDNIAELYSTLGNIAKQNGQEEKSQHYYEKSLSLKEGKRPISAANQFAKLAIVNRTKKNFEKAENYHKKAIEIYQENNNQNGVISQTINLGFLYKVWNKLDQACSTWSDSYKQLNPADSRYNRVGALLQANCQ